MRQAYDYWQDQPGTYHRRRSRALRAPPARVRAPTRARAPHAGPPRASSAGTRPQPGPGGFGRRARLPTPRRSAPRAGLGAELPMRGGPLGRSLASPRPAPSSPGRTTSPPPSGSHFRSASASTRQAVARPSVLSGCVLRLGQRRATRRPQPARFPCDGCPAERHLASPRTAPPSATAWSRRLQTPGRVSPRLRPGWGPSCPCGVAPSGARSPAPGLRRPLLAEPRLRLLLVHTFGAPAPPCVKRASRYCQAAYCDSDEGVRAVGHSQRASPGTAALQVTRRPPLASRPGPVSTRRRTGARIRTPHGRPGLGSVGVRSWCPGRRQRPCHRALCVLTRRGCPILYVPAQCAPAKTEALLPSRFREGGETSSPPKMGGEERGLLLLPSRFREGRSVGRAGRRAAPGVATGRGTLADGRGGGMHRSR